MNNHRPRVDMPRFDVTSDEQLSKMADRQSQLPAWNREQLIRQFQGIDGCTRSEAERQIDAYARSFLTNFGGSTITRVTQDNTREWSKIPQHPDAAIPRNAVQAGNQKRAIHGKNR